MLWMEQPTMSRALCRVMKLGVHQLFRCTVSPLGLERCKAIRLVHVVPCKAEQRLVELTDVHATRNAEWIEDDINRLAIGKMGHVARWDNLGNHALISVPTGELIANSQAALNHHLYLHAADPRLAWRARRLLPSAHGRRLHICVHLDVHDAALDPPRQAKRHVTHLLRLLAENRLKQCHLRRELGGVTRHGLAHEYHLVKYHRSHANNAALVEVA
mmetsp:Transcript_4432/g.10961  ORF Transcript_4432/g.10961 Transcript_4432/m.10961 type:complete len:216 (-) Transcript_4432:1543-2190(-)